MSPPLPGEEPRPGAASISPNRPDGETPVIDDATPPTNVGTAPATEPSEAPTLDLRDVPPADVVAADLDPASRFDIVALLGSGGTGRVFRAFDRRLDRLVALKLLRAGQQFDLLLHEARAQARIDHPNVCKVYEAGLLRGEPFIAMQLIEGPTLDHAAPAMSLEQRVAVMRLVAEGVHAAHRQGLIHRDLKPANVMVVRDEAAGWIPYVTDFGLAHREDSQHTLAGAILGTPAYMAPEQARGENTATDRRTDVYGLGATLYAVLLGRSPFAAESVSAVLHQVLHDEPTPPRQVLPSLPVDLETIVLKCLEKDPDRRYPSARALAEDLRRYLDGDPVEARPAGLFYRLGKRARKNRVATAALLAAALVAAGAASLVIRSSWLAGERERLASHFAEEGRDMEAVMERSRLLPLHDVGYARTLVRQRMERLRAEIAAAGERAAAAGHYALGRGHLALGEYGTARRELELARAADRGGLAGSEGLDYALGLALVELYRVELAAARRIENPEARRERLTAIDGELRQPALEHLRRLSSAPRDGARSGAEVAPGDYAEALLAFLDRDYPRAVERARLAEARSPWLYTAAILQGDAWLEIGVARRDQGRADARAAFAAAEESFRAAARKGGSDPRSYEGLAQLYLDEMYMDLVQTGRPLRAAFEAARDASRRALQVDPERAVAWSLLSTASLRWGQDQAGRGEDAVPSYREAIADAERAVALDPRDERSLKSLGDSYALFGLHEYGFDRPAEPLLAKAVAAYSDAIRINPQNPALHSNLGMAYDYLAIVRGDATPEWIDGHRRQAEARYREAVRLAPGESDYWNNLGSNLLRQAQDHADRGEDPTARLLAAIRALEEATRRNSENTSAHNNLGYAAELLGDYEMSRLGHDPRPQFARAVAALGEVLRRNPEHSTAYRNLGDTLVAQATYERTMDLPWRATLARARQAYEASLRANDEEYATWVALANSWLPEIDARRAVGEDASAALAAAERALGSAEAVAAGAPAVLATRAELELRRALRAAALGRDPTGRFAAAETAARRAGEAESTWSGWPVVRARVLDSLATWQITHPPADLAATIARGLDACTRALALDPDQPDALALRASFLELAARGEHDPARRARLLADGRASLASAIARSPLLARDHGALGRALGLP